MEFECNERMLIEMDNWLGLEGKVVIVTGGACGIGYAVVEDRKSTR